MSETGYMTDPDEALMLAVLDADMSDDVVEIPSHSGNIPQSNAKQVSVVAQVHAAPDATPEGRKANGKTPNGRNAAGVTLAANQAPSTGKTPATNQPMTSKAMPAAVAPSTSKTAAAKQPMTSKAVPAAVAPSTSKAPAGKQPRTTKSMPSNYDTPTRKRGAVDPVGHSTPKPKTAKIGGPSHSEALKMSIGGMSERARVASACTDLMMKKLEHLDERIKKIEEYAKMCDKMIVTKADVSVMQNLYHHIKNELDYSGRPNLVQRGSGRLSRMKGRRRYLRSVAAKLLIKAKKMLSKRKSTPEPTPTGSGADIEQANTPQGASPSTPEPTPTGSGAAIDQANSPHGASPSTPSPAPTDSGSDIEQASSPSPLSPASPTDQPPPVFVERVRRWERVYAAYRGVAINEEFRFVNMELIRSYPEAVAALYNAIRQIFDEINSRIEPDDFIQLRLQAEGLPNALYSVRRLRDALSVEEFLSNIANLLQSRTEILGDVTLRLVITVVSPPRGAGRRPLNSIPESSIISKKRRHLVDLNIVSTTLCFAGGLIAVMSDTTHTDAELLEAARNLHMELGWSDQKCVSLNDIATIEQHLKVNIHVVRYTGSKWSLFKPQGPKHSKTYYMLLLQGHYYGVLNVQAFFGSRNFCTLCSTPFTHHHNCSAICRLCLSPDCESTVGELQRCPQCKLKCRSRQCLDRHEILAAEEKVSCPMRQLCENCGFYVGAGHEAERPCVGAQCRVCWARFEELEGHACYMGSIKKPKLSQKYVFYDFECHQETGEHIPNYAFAKAFEGDSYDTVTGVAGVEARRQRKKNWREAGKSWEFSGESCLSDFIRTFTTSIHFKNTTFIAHNAKAYDSYFIVSQLIREKLPVKLITQGGKLICITVESLKLRFIDSLNHLPMALAVLPRALGFSSVSKGNFPFYFNTPDHWNYRGEMPAIEYYGVDHMKAEAKAEFLAWYRDNRSNTFDMQKEIAHYCQQDVNILAEACTRYRREIIQMTAQVDDDLKFVAIDPFQYLTLASVSLAMYRFMFLPPKTIAIPPVDNYHHDHKRYSTPSIQWLMYIEHKEKIQIQHALKGGERRVGKYFLDGFAVVHNQKTAFEFNGCFYHGCPQCYPPQAKNPLLGKTNEFLYNSTQSKAAKLKSWGYKVVSLWEHEWHDMVQTDADLKAFLCAAQFPEPLEPRDALFGGRTNAISLYYKPAAGEQVHYYDFCSLYPYVNKTKAYPVGHPKIIHENFKPIHKYFGIAKVKIYPPRGLFFPVLPVRVGGKLMFPLCSLCAETRQLEACKHTDEERALQGTWCTVELEMALAKGYRIAKIWEVWHFERRSKSLFSSYIEMHLRQKQEASGYPQWCVSDADKEKYIREFHKKEGVLLRQDNIAANPAKRQIAKLFLNSLWGKFAQRTNLPNTTIVRDPDELFNYLFSGAYDVSMCEFIDEDAACISWRHAKNRIEPARTTNVFIACFTTAYARLKLYSLLDGLQERCLYHDTDSVIFVSKPGEWNPPLGDYLGELTSEVPPDRHITEFVSTGPKSYGLKFSDNSTSLKVKGITLNVSNSEKINFASLKDLVFSYVSDQPKEIVVEQFGIVRDKKRWAIETKPLRKTQKVVYDKRVICDGFKTLPYGY